MFRGLPLTALGFVLACGVTPGKTGSVHPHNVADSGAAADAGSQDAGREDDAGSRDGGQLDAGRADAGRVDAGEEDAGVGNDDAGQGDAGVQFDDAGSVHDAGPAPLCPDLNEHNGGDGACIAAGTCSLGFSLRADGRCTAWTSGPPLIDGAGGSFMSLVVHGNDLYLLCGPGPDEHARLSQDGLSPWDELPIRDPTLFFCFGAVVGDELYVMGGFSFDTGDDSTQVIETEINADGSVSGWSTSASTLTIARSGAGVAVVNDNLIVAGGTLATGEGISSIEAFPLQPGSLGSSSLLGATSDQNAYTTIAVHSDYVAVLGNSFDPENIVIRTSTDPQLATWSAYDGDPSISQACTVEADGTYFSIGGTDGSAIPNPIHDVVDVATVTSSGAPGAWQRVGVLDQPRLLPQCAVIGDTIVVVGGQSTDIGNLSSTAFAKTTAAINSVEAP